MTTHASRQLLVAAALLAAVALFALGFFVALSVRSVVAGPDSAPSASAPNPGHSWSEIGDLPGTMWHSNNDGPGSGLDADTVDGQDSSEVGGITSCWNRYIGLPGGTGDQACALDGGYCVSVKLGECGTQANADSCDVTLVGCARCCK
jgi:hypothetical protein